MKKIPITIKAAWIGFGGLILAALIAGFFTYKADKQTATVTSSPEATIYQAGGDIVLQKPPSKNEVIKSILLEARLTCSLKAGKEIPPEVAYFTPVTGAPALFEGPPGSISLNFQSPIRFHRLEQNEIIIINRFALPNVSALLERPVNVLKNYDNLIVPIVTSMYGHLFSKLQQLEVTITLNGEPKWYKAWKYDVQFPKNQSFNVSLTELIGESNKILPE